MESVLDEGVAVHFPPDSRMGSSMPGLISDPLCDEGRPELCAAVDEAFQTYGLLRWEDGSRKAGFQVLLDAVAGLLPEE